MLEMRVGAVPSVSERTTWATGQRFQMFLPHRRMITVGKVTVFTFISRPLHGAFVAMECFIFYTRGCIEKTCDLSSRCLFIQ